MTGGLLKYSCCKVHGEPTCLVWCLVCRSLLCLPQSAASYGVCVVGLCVVGMHVVVGLRASVVVCLPLVRVGGLSAAACVCCLLFSTRVALAPG